MNTQTHTHTYTQTQTLPSVIEDVEQLKLPYITGL